MRTFRWLAAKARLGAAGRHRGMVVWLLVVVLWNLRASGNGVVLALTSLVQVENSIARITQSDPMAARTDADRLVFPALVSEGEPESVLGVKWVDGVPRSENAQQLTIGSRRIVWSPGGRLLATDSGMNFVRIWDTTSGKETRRLKGGSSHVTSLAFSPDGNLLATGGSDRFIRIFDVATGEELLSLEGHSRSVSSVTFSPEGGVLVSGSEDQTIRSWDVATGKELLRFEELGCAATSVTFSPNGEALASACSDNSVRVWSVATGKGLLRLEGHTAPPTSVAFSPEGGFLASGGTDSEIAVWDAATGKMLRRIQGHRGMVTSVAFSPVGTSLVSSSMDGSIRIWDPKAGIERLGIWAQGHVVTSLAFGPDGASLASTGLGDTPRIWDVATGRMVRQLGGRLCAATSIAFSPDGGSLGIASTDCGVQIWDALEGRELRRFLPHSGEVRSLAFSPDSRLLASGCLDGSVRVWDPVSGKGLWRRKLEVDSDGNVIAIASVVFSSDGRFLASTVERASTWILDAGTGRQLWKLTNSVDQSVAFGPDGQSVFSVGGDGRVRIWDATTGKEVRQLNLEGYHGEFTSAAFSPSGTFLAFASEKGGVQIWDAATGMHLRRFEFAKGLRGRYPGRLTFSPDETLLAVADSLNGLYVWNVIAGREVKRIDRRCFGMKCVFSADSALLVVPERGDSSIQLWSVQNATDSPITAYWASRDGWASWRMNAPSERRVVRGENGALLRRVDVHGVLNSIPPNTAQSPELAASASVVRSAGQSEFGEIVVAAANAREATEGMWLELRTPNADPETPLWGTVFRPPPTMLRLGPGDSTTLSVGYIRHVAVNPSPGLASAVLELHHAHDGGKAISLPVELRFRSPQIVANFGTIERQGLDPVVPIALTNVGDQATGGELAIDAEFFLANGSTVSSHLGLLYGKGIAPGVTENFFIRIPKELQDASQFRVVLTATEGISAGISSKRTAIGPVATWTVQSGWLRARPLWHTLVAIGLGAAIALAGVYYFRVYRNPIVVQIARNPSSLLHLPLHSLPRASRALSRARRLNGALGALGVSTQQWQRSLIVALSPSSAIEELTAVLGARVLKTIDEQCAHIELPGLRVRFGPSAAIAMVEGARVDPGQSRRLIRTLRDSGLASAVVLDFTQTANGNILVGVAGMSLVVLSSDVVLKLLLAKHPTLLLEREIASQRPLIQISPYRTAGGVEDSSMFFGRVEELRRLGDWSHNAILVGARQMGKSSLLKALRARLLMRGDVDVRYVALSGSDLMGTVAQSLNHDAPANTQEFTFLLRGNTKRHVVWLIDEADEFAEADLEQVSLGSAPISGALRAITEEGNASVVLAGFWRLFRATVLNPNSPLRNFGELVRLGPLDPDAARALITQPMSSLGIAVDTSVVNTIVEWTGQHASLLVLTCQGLVERLRTNQRKISTLELSAVWDGHRPLLDALRYWKAEPIDRAVGHAAMALGSPTRSAIEERLATAGICLAATELDRSLERLELGYTLLRQGNPDGELDQYRCAIPLIHYLESRTMSWEEHLETDACEIRRM